MMFNVPQFINVEDKIAGPLTWKQLLWMIGMGAALLLSFSVFDSTFAIVLAVPIVLIFVAFAFYKPNGFPLANFVGNGVLFLFRPKVAVWERPLQKLPSMTQKRTDPTTPKTAEKKLSEEKLKELAHILDNAS